MRIFIYSRKSVYTGKGESVENQIEMCRQYIQKRIEGGSDAEITIYEDEGFSGKNLDRPRFQKMLSDAKGNKPNFIVCYRLDRISRSVGDFAPLVEQLITRDIGLICIKEQFDTSTPMGKAMMYIASVFAQLERETIAERVRDNMLMLARTGRWLGGSLPTGFLSEKVEEVVVDKRTKISCKLKWNPEEIETARLIFQTFLALRSISGVSKHLMRAGIKSRTGKFYSLPGIKDILQNPVYCIADREARDYFVAQGSDVCFAQDGCSEKLGLLSYNKRDYSKSGSPRLAQSEWIIAVGRHKGIICGADWVTVQQILQQNKPASQARNAHNDYALLSGILICKQCGARMFAKPRSNSKGLFDYICDRKLHGGSAICSCQNLNGQTTDVLVCRALFDHIKANPGILPLLDALRQRISAENQSVRIESLDQKTRRLEAELDQLAAALSCSALSPSLIRRMNDRAEALDQRLAACYGERAQLQSAGEIPPVGQAQIERMAQALSRLPESFAPLPICEKRELIRLLILRAEWDETHLDVLLSDASSLGEVAPGLAVSVEAAFQP